MTVTAEKLGSAGICSDVSGTAGLDGEAAGAGVGLGLAAAFGGVGRRRTELGVSTTMPGSWVCARAPARRPVPVIIAPLRTKTEDQGYEVMAEPLRYNITHGVRRSAAQDKRARSGP